ncbi:uncharacterized protein [Asterias amurensis]|uniref:uncharacterized protein isoform X1 n=2 Tax=Asterias amurensis TaxID=7602 RepID=UPI003AB39080
MNMCAAPYKATDYQQRVSNTNMDQEPTEHNAVIPTWPKFLLTVLTLLGVFKGRPLDACRPCYDCRHKRGDGGKSIGNCDAESRNGENRNVENNHEADGSSRPDCAVCSSLLWNADGEIVRDCSKAVPGWLNSRVCGVLSNLLILTFLGCSTFTLGWYVVSYWGQISNINHLVSFLAFGDIIVGVALVCTLSNAVQYRRREPVSDWSWYDVLHQDYILRRLRCLAGRRFPLPKKVFLIFSLVWLFVVNTMQVVLLVNSLSRVNATLLTNDSCMPMGISLIEKSPPTKAFTILNTTMVIFVSIIGLAIYTLFWYNILVMRTALATELNLVIVFIKRNTGNLDLCRRRVFEINHDFRILHVLLATLMPFIVASSVLGLTVHITWNYQIYSEKDKGIAMRNLLINIFIFTSKCFILILPLLAVGGINIDFIWQQFNYALMRQRNSRHEEFWERLLGFTAELQDERKAGHNLMLFLSLISLYLGRNLSGQRLDYTTNHGLL